jgi:hypothetical protein
VKSLCCDRRSLYSWFSGFFAAGALTHLARSVFGVSLVVGGYTVSRGLSAAVCVALGTLSITFCMIAHRYQGAPSRGAVCPR